jgi:hypothetical protein
MARKKNRDIAWESGASIRGKNPRAWRRDDRGNRIRYGSFRTSGEYTWTLQRGKPVSTGLNAWKYLSNADRDTATHAFDPSGSYSMDRFVNQCAIKTQR